MKRTLLAAVFSLAAVPALAFNCPADMTQIDAALAAGPSISSSDLARVKTLRAEGEQLHKAGRHRQSLYSLARAKALLGIE